MQAQQFVASAHAAAVPLGTPGARVGWRTEHAVAASWAAAGCNTNLGIVLLAAPLARAAEAPGALADAAALRRALADVLAALDLDDARAAFRGIAMANPGGLGDAGDDDVRRAPRLTLLQAMQQAAARDRIAHQYASGFDDVFEAAEALGFARIAAGDPAAREAAIQRVYLGVLARWPDSHIVRKHGEAVAQNVMSAAQRWRTHSSPGLDPAFAAWDESLKAAALNPGTSADLTVAALFVAGLLQGGWHGT
jgi:triphosphoribosyl-dephospho-CoA synthase